MLTKIKARWRGFVPNFYAHPLDLCAFYHCKRERHSSGQSVKCPGCARSFCMAVDMEVGYCPECSTYITKSQRRKLENLILGNMPLRWP